MMTCITNCHLHVLRSDEKFGDPEAKTSGS